MAASTGTKDVRVSQTFGPASRTATGNGTGVDMSGTVNPGLHEYRAHMATGTVSGTTPTNDVKMQDSDDNSVWADITGAVFAQVTASTNVQDIYFRSPKRYLRAVSTMGGTTPNFTFYVDIYSKLRTV